MLMNHAAPQSDEAPSQEKHTPFSSFCSLVTRTRRNWPITLSIGGMTFIVAFLCSLRVASVTESLMIAAAFIVLWFALCIILPPLAAAVFLIAVAIGAIVGLVVLCEGLGLLEGVIAWILGILALCIGFFLAVLAAILLPGALAGLAAFAAFGGEGEGLAVGVIVFLIVTAIVYLVLKYVLPFLLTAGWVFGTGVVAWNVAVLAISGRGGMSSPTLADSWSTDTFVAAARDGIDALRIAYHPPMALAVWMLLLAIAGGIAVTIFEAREPTSGG